MGQFYLTINTNAAQNYIESARIEQQNWNDEARGTVADAMATDFSFRGDIALHDALSKVDPRDRGKFMLTGAVAKEVYDYAWNTSDSWEFVKHQFGKRYGNSVSLESLRDIYESAKRDRIDSETPYLNAEVKTGEALGKVESGDVKGESRGKFTDESPYNVTADGVERETLTATDRIIYEELAKTLNANITMIEANDKRLERVDPETGQIAYANAKVDLKSGQIFISNMADPGKVIHEAVHIGAMLAPTEYLEMHHSILDAAYKYDREGTTKLINRYKKLYEGQDLTDAQIEEEVVADLVTVFRNDPVFARELADQNPSVFKRILNAIEDLLRALRNMLATGHIRDEAIRESLLYEIGAYDDTRKMLLRVFRESQKNKAAVGIAEWNERAILKSQAKAINEGEGLRLQNDLDELVKAVSEDMGLEYSSFKPKSVDSMVNKVIRKNTPAEIAERGGERYELGDMKDHARNKIVLNDFSEESIRGALNRLVSVIGTVNVEYKHKPNGYRGFHITSSGTNGLNFELQLTTKGHWAIKSAEDAIYDKWRNYTDIDSEPESVRQAYLADMKRSSEMWSQFDPSELDAAKSSLSETADEFQYSAADIGEEGLTQSPFTNSENVALSSNLMTLPSSNLPMNAMSDTSSRDVSENITSNEENGNRVDVASEATNYYDNGNMMSAEEIESALRENFDEYKEDKENLRIAAEAIDDLQHSRFSITATANTSQSGSNGSREQIRTVGKGITATLVNEGYIDFRGQKVNGPEDLAKLCQVLRDPRFETFRIALTKGDKIVSFVSISSRLPGQSFATESLDLQENADIVKDRMHRSGADGYYLIHNHPSGNVTASDDDLRLTAAYLALVGQNTYKGHIILDHDKYGLIEDIPQNINGMTLPSAREALISGQQTIDLIHEPEIDHPILGEQIRSPGDIAKCGKFVSSSDDISVLLYSSLDENRNYSVRGIQEISNKTFKNNKEIKGYIKNQSVEMGSQKVVLYTTDIDTYAASKDLIKSAHLMDSVIGYGLNYSRTESGRSVVSPDKNIITMGMDDDAIWGQTRVFESAAEAADYRYSITPQMDVDYMDAVNSGNTKEAQRLVDEAAKMAMPNTKLKGHWYHGTQNDFNIFDFSQGGKNGTAEGMGIYVTNDPEITQTYGNRMIDGYVNMTRPASFLESQTLTKAELRKLVNATIEYDAKRMLEEYDGDLETAKKDSWISNYVDTYGMPLDKAVDEVIKSITTLNGNDMDIVQEIMTGMAIREFDQATEFYDILTETTGIDGFLTKWGDDEDLDNPDNPTIAVAFRSSQVKSSDPVTYADDGSVIPLSERFDPNNDDIRYSLATQDANGRVLSDGQMNFFANSQARDAEGKLVPVYHSTSHGGFTIFDPSYSDDNRSLFFTSDYDMSRTYINSGEDFDPYKFGLPKPGDIM